jgi:hypothetical protein
MKYALAYAVIFLLAFTVFLFAVWVAIAAVVLIVMFVTWSVPSALIVTWSMLRITIAIAAGIAAAFTLSNDGKDVAKDFVNGYDRART